MWRERGAIQRSVRSQVKFYLTQPALYASAPSGGVSESRLTRCAVAGAPRREAKRAKRVPTQDWHGYHTSRHPQPFRQVSTTPSYTSQTTFCADKTLLHLGHGNCPRSASCWISASIGVRISSGRGSTSTGSGSVSDTYFIAYYKRLSNCIYLCRPDMLQL